MPLPKANADMFNKAIFYRLEQRFDESLVLFRQIVLDDPEAAESYWNIVLCTALSGEKKR